VKSTESGSTEELELADLPVSRSPDASSSQQTPKEVLVFGLRERLVLKQVGLKRGSIKLDGTIYLSRQPVS